MRNNKLTLFFVSQTFAFIYFWLAIAIPYMIYRGLTPTEAFSLMAIYQFIGVFLEYPTGILGDRFGYRKVTYISNTLNCIAMFTMAMQGGYYLYLFALTILAIGNGLSSGNDMGILKSISTNIKKDTANYNALADFVLFLSAVVGGFISRISFEAALIISGFCNFLANIPLYFLKSEAKHSKNVNSIKTIFTDSFKELHNPTFKQLFIIIALFGGYSFTIKSILGSFGSVYQIDVATIGIIVGLGSLARSIGGKLFAEIQKQNITAVAILIGLSLILVGVFPNYHFVVVLMILIQLLFGYILSKIDGDIHDLAEDHVRSSLFSLKRLTMRLVASSYLAIYGYAIGIGQFVLISYITGSVLIIGSLFAWQYLQSKTSIKTIK